MHGLPSGLLRPEDVPRSIPPPPHFWPTVLITPELKPSPHPMQAAIGDFGKLKAFRNPQSFDPKHRIPRIGGDNELMTERARHFMIDEQVLKFNGVFHANWLKPIRPPPVPQENPSTHPIGIEPFVPGGCRWTNIAPF